MGHVERRVWSGKVSYRARYRDPAGREPGAGHEPLHRIAQVVDLLRIDQAHLRQRALGFGVAGRGDERRQQRHAPIVQRSLRRPFGTRPRVRRRPTRPSEDT